jgi:hypothetical protein
LALSGRRNRTHECLLLALFGRAAMSGLSPQCGQQRTFRQAASKATPPPQSL